MKSILYVGAALMIGASIYGFVDYKKTSHKKEFIRMYEDQPSVTVADEKDPTSMHTVAEEVKTAAIKKETSSNLIKEVKKTIQHKKMKSKKLDYKLFSRSRPPQREPVEIDEVPEPKKAEVKKMVEEQ